MTNALATQQTSIAFTDDVGANITVTADDVRNLICPNADQKEVALFLQLCKSQRLNPFVKDAYLVKYGSNPAQMITNYQVFNRRACKNENYGGIENGVTVLRKRRDRPQGRKRRLQGGGRDASWRWAKVIFQRQPQTSLCRGRAGRLQHW